MTLDDTAIYVIIVWFWFWPENFGKHIALVLKGIRESDVKDNASADD